MSKGKCPYCGNVLVVGQFATAWVAQCEKCDFAPEGYGETKEAALDTISYPPYLMGRLRITANNVGVEKRDRSFACMEEILRRIGYDPQEGGEEKGDE